MLLVGAYTRAIWSARQTFSVPSFGRYTSLCVGTVIMLFVCKVHAFEQSSTTNTQSHDENIQIASQVLPIGTAYQNSIKLLNNRFRVDSDISEVTLVFFREYGSSPVVLVRPDGSKLFLENDDVDDSFKWFETNTYDMIALKNPMPGPWQAVGQILPQSRVMVIAGITLNAKPIPKTVFSGETLKQTAFLENAGSKVDMSQFRDIVSLSIEFSSTNNPDYPNFGLGSRSVARFEDDGLGLDEQDSDGIFTGKFNLAITQGEWQPVFTVRTPLFSREQVNEKIILLPNPVLLSHKLEVTQDKDHQLYIDVNKDYVDLASVLVDGSVRLPNGENINFSISQPSDNMKEIDIMNADFGIFKVNMTVFATTNEGRDLVLSVPEYTFVTEPPPIEPEPLVEVVEQVSLADEIIVAQEPDEAPLVLVIVINLCLLVLGGLSLFLLADKRNNPQSHLALRILNKMKSIKFKKLKKQDKAAPAS